VEGPEGALAGRSLGGEGERDRARVPGLQREVAEDHARVGVRQPLGVDRAARAGEVGVEESDGRLSRASHVVVVAQGRHRCAAQVRHAVQSGD
jgi:hypothetical protein